MSDDGSNLGMLIAAFDHKAAEIEQQNSQALLDIQAASQKLEALRRDQAQATSQLATSRQTMAKLPASDAQHPELQNSIQSLEQKQQARAAEISAQAQALQRLNDAQKLEAAQHRLRREQSAFIVQVDAALARIADGAVRYLFATRALAACEARKITPTFLTTSRARRSSPTCWANWKMPSLGRPRPSARMLPSTRSLWPCSPTPAVTCRLSSAAWPTTKRRRARSPPAKRRRKTPFLAEPPRELRSRNHRGIPIA